MAARFPGTEAAGIIVEAGAGADRALIGAPVVRFGHFAGVYAELTPVPADYVVPLPGDAASMSPPPSP